KSRIDLRARGATRRRRLVGALPRGAECRVAPLERNTQADAPDVALPSKIAGPLAGRVQKCLVVVAFGMSDGVLHGGVFAQAEDMDVHRGAGEPFAQSADERLIVALTEFGNH